jgi:long-chain acyl-CoA synthetase
MSGTSTLVTRLAEYARKAPDAAALHGGNPESGFTSITWREYEQLVRSVGKSLIALDVNDGDNITIAGRNRPEWIISDVGVLAAGAVPTPIYATNTDEQVAWLVNHCESAVAIIDDEGQYEKFAAKRSEMPNLKHVVLMGDVPGRDREWTLSWDEFLTLGEDVSDSDLDQRITTAKPDDLALLCYTSGTTGEPKGVMLTHANFDSIGRSVRGRYPIRELDERIISYLPLCHIAEHAFTIILQMNNGVEVFTCDDINDLKEYLPEVRPTMFLAVPRVWEKFEAALRSRLGEATGVKAMLADWAMTTEYSWFQSELDSGKPVTGVTRKVADKLVINKVKAALGMDQVHLCASGAAPLNKTTAEFFASLGLPIHEVYGMTETTAIITLPTYRQTRPGYVGQVPPGVEVVTADDGEILVKGPNITPGYLKNPEQTAELLDQDDWLHTGDIGELGSDGYLRITDRKKELFKTSGGKYVAPAPIEAKLKSIPGVGQAVLVGDGQRFIAALLALDPDNVDQLVVTLGLPEGTDASAASTDPTVHAHIERQVNTIVNSELARFEQVKKVLILPHELTPETGELTPTLKLRRKPIAEIHADEIAAIFA